MIISILSISSPGEEYSEMKKIQTEYYSNFPNVNFYFVENDEKQKEKIKIVDNIIYVRGTEHVLHILYKSIVAMKWIQKNIKTDWFIRTNVSALINIPNLEKHLREYSKNNSGNLYTGPIIPMVESYNMSSIIATDVKEITEQLSICVIQQKRCPGVNESRYFKIYYVGGSCIIMSKDIFNNICDNSHMLKYFLPDDVAIFEYIYEYHRHWGKSIGMTFKKDNYEDDIGDETLYRFKTDKDRKADIQNMRKVCEKLIYLKNEKNKD